jgi:RNA polymerase-binding transcription factor DksA
MIDITGKREVLQARLAELDSRLHEIEGSLETRKSNDWEEAAVEREEDEVLERMGTAGQAEMRMIRAALARIEAGEYGYCTECGEEISPDRLDLLPGTPFCKTCAAKHH